MDASNDPQLDQQLEQQIDQNTQQHDGDTAGATLVEDSLIDEVSIDGMCGVY